LADKEPVAFKGSDDVVYDGLTKAQIEEKLIAEK